MHAHHLDADGGTGCRTEVVAQHVDGVHAALGLGVDREYAHLVGNLGREDAQVQQDDSDDQPCQAVSPEAEHREGRQHHHQGEADQAPCADTIDQTARRLGPEDAGQPDDTEQPCLLDAVVKRRIGDVNGQRRPHGIEGREPQCAGQCGLSQQGMFLEQRAHREDQSGVGHLHGRRATGQVTMQQHTDYDGEDGRDQEDAAPAPVFADAAAQSA